ncbi:hypothetical protein B0J11DRAFT_315464 [Dendryphion nanum]|uniref:Uncharacterized protein n=1 Tax=Dendryphion nanum TaxID=256645 RepID=A0A9P9DPW6_9PLEO|nr:hypothetical protein B0J11DRAFT_315464 [Dendryphion nanum]
MDCKHIGQANPDIAGIGILVAFVVQSLIAVIVSGYTWILSAKIQTRWSAVNQEPHNDPSDDELRQWIIVKLNIIADYALSVANPLRPNGGPAVLHEWFFGKQTSLGDWLFGKQPLEPRQWMPGSSIEDEVTPTTRRLEFGNRILLAGSDAQTFTGIALLISALIQSNTMSLYHMHIIYDTISLVVISNCAASICIFREGRVKGYIRLSLIMIWTALFITYFAIFAQRLQTWDYQTPLQCYKTNAISNSRDRHPYFDNIYISLTFFFIMCSLFYALYISLGGPLRNKWSEFASAIDAFLSSAHDSGAAKFLTDFITGAAMPAMFHFSLQLVTVSLPMLSGQMSFPATELQRRILGIAMLQCPLHIYSIFALRASNERFLEEGGAERQWGFGQIAAVVLLAGNLLPIVDGIASLSDDHRTRRALELLNERVEEQVAIDQAISQNTAQSDEHATTAA